MSFSFLTSRARPMASTPVCLSSAVIEPRTEVFLPTATIFQPALHSLRHVASPMPLVAPVITATGVFDFGIRRIVPPRSLSSNSGNLEPVTRHLRDVTGSQGGTNSRLECLTRQIHGVSAQQYRSKARIRPH